MKTEHSNFGGFPSNWVREGRLKNITADQPYSLAMLKLFLALVCWHGKLESEEERGQNPPGVFSTCSPTYSDLQKISGLDRSEISPAILELELFGIVAAERNKGGRNIYTVLNPAKPGWAKVPLSLVEEAKLRELSLKHSNTPVNMRKQQLLDSLKVYLLLLAFRDNMKNRANVSYDKIEELAGVRRRHIRRALIVLGLASLIHVDQSSRETPEGTLRHSNTYFIVGLADFRPKRGILENSARQAS